MVRWFDGAALLHGGLLRQKRKRASKCSVYYVRSVPAVTTTPHHREQPLAVGKLQNKQKKLLRSNFPSKPPMFAKAWCDVRLRSRVRLRVVLIVARHQGVVNS